MRILADIWQAVREVRVVRRQSCWTKKAVPDYSSAMTNYMLLG